MGPLNILTKHDSAVSSSSSPDSNNDKRLMHGEWNLIEMSPDQLGQGLPCKTTHVLISCAEVHACNPICRVPSIISESTLSSFNTAHSCPVHVKVQS